MKRKIETGDEISEKFFNMDRPFVLMELGKFHLNDEDYEAAIKAFSEAININGCPMSYLLRAKAYRELEQFEDALADLNTCLTINPAMDEAYEGKGICLYYLNRCDEAIESFNTAIKRKQDAPEDFIYYNRALCYKEKANWQAAIEDLTEAIKLCQHADSYAQRAFCYGKAGDYSLGLNDIDSAIYMDGSNPQYYATRAELAELIYVGEKEKAKG